MKNKKAITQQSPIRVKANISNFMAKFHQTFKEEIMMSSYSIFKKNKKKYLEPHSNIKPLPKSNIETKKEKKENIIRERQMKITMRYHLNVIKD